MKRTLLHNVEQLRYFAMLLIVAWCGSGIASALESDEINDAILVDGSLVVEWVNDPSNPWIISPDGSFVRIPISEGNYSTTLSMLYTSEYPIDLNLDWYFYGSYDTKLTVSIDGYEINVPYTYDWKSLHRIIPSGTHKIDFSATIDGYTDDVYFVGINNVALREYKPLETACLKEGSMPLTFINDPEHPWLTYDGYVQSMTNDIIESNSAFSTTFSIDQPSLFSFEYRGTDASYNQTLVSINGEPFESTTYGYWNEGSVVLYPGTYTIEFANSHDYPDENYSYSQVRNICLSQDWINVTLNQPGELSTRLIQALGDRNLQDADIVKINGSLNETDWNTISQLTGIKAIDFTGTDITSVPAQAFYQKNYLSTVMLPETVTEIGSSAFQNTNNFYEITIPSSVETIGDYAWQESNLKYIHFTDNSNLKHIGFGAFHNSDVREFIMPNSVTSLGLDGQSQSFTFYRCYSLKKLHLSDGLSHVPDEIAYQSNIEEVHLPVNATSIGNNAFRENNITSIEIPESVTSIGYYAFAYTPLESITIPKNVSTFGDCAFRECRNLKTAVLNSHCWDMNYTFLGCTALETVVLPCATPPSVYRDPFHETNKSNITLIVPDFALQSYRTDNYWYGFTNIQAGDEASLNDYWAIRGNLSLDSSHIMRGTPSIEMMTGGTITMDTDMTQTFDEFTFNTGESAPAAFLSKSNNVTANRLYVNFYISESNKWFFFSPLADVSMSDVTYPSTDSWVIRYYDGERRGVQNDNSGNWVNVPSDGMLKRGQGYIIQAASTGWLEMPVAADKHDQFFGSNEVNFELADNPSEGEANAGWNFVSNPYPCYYDIYYIDMQAPITVWNGSTYRAYSLNDGDRGDDTFVLRPMQPFFVQKDNSELSTGMPLTGRRTNTVIDRSRAPKREIPANNQFRNKLNLELFAADKDEADDYTRIVLNEEASMDYEKLRDASKFMSIDSKVAQLFSLGDGNTPMAINERPYDNGIVALGVYLPVNGETYTISATRADRQAWLHDTVTGIEHDLTAADYVFTANKEGFDYKRFSIRFAPGSTAVETIDGMQVKVTAANGAIIVTAADDAEVAVYATDGTNVANATGSAKINVPAGIYVVKVNDRTFKTIVK